MATKRRPACSRSHCRAVVTTRLESTRWLSLLLTIESRSSERKRLQRLSLRPSEYVRRQVRATPYPAEDVGWIAEQAGPEVCLFSSDYPHVEGGRNPIKRFEESLDGAPEATVQAFYFDNFVDLMGAGLDHLA